VPPAYVDTEGTYTATFTIVAATKTRIDKRPVTVTDRV
jgi:hypothetical protein